MLLLWWESWEYISRCCFYMTKSGSLAFIQSCCFCFQHQMLLSSVCDMGPVVVIKHLLCAYKNPAAGAFYHIAQPTIKSDPPLRSEGKKRANGETFWAPGSCVSSCFCLRSRVCEGRFPPWSADLLAALGLGWLQKPPVCCTFFYLIKLRCWHSDIKESCFALTKATCKVLIEILILWVLHVDLLWHNQMFRQKNA